MIKSLALANLTISQRNVRRVSDEAADAQLAADIAARGLLNNLVVTPSRPKGMFAVEAGGRRLRALHKLQFDGVLPVDHKVACLVLSTDAAAATEASLAENFHRLAMNPADECLAFGTLIEQGADVEGVARRFGLTVRFVEGRLRLANLALVVFEALGAGEITLDAAKAYAATSDQERQAYVFDQLNNSWGGAHPDSIRRMMVNATVPANDRRFRFVGEEVYVAAGGRIERDLFEDESQARLLDIAILERLAIEKLEAEAERQCEALGYGFVRPTLDLHVNGWQYDDLRRLSVEPEPLSEEELEAVATLETEVEAQIAVLEDEDADDHARDVAETKICELEAAIDAISDKPMQVEPALRPNVGVFLLIDGEGRPRLDKAVYAPVVEDSGAPDGESALTEGRAGSENGGTGSSAEGGPVGIGGSAAVAEPKSAKLSQRLVDELAMQRRDILALHIAADPALALDLAVVLMVADEGGYTWDGAGSTLTARRPSDPVLISAMPAASAAIVEARAKTGEALDRTWLDHASMAERFDAFRALSRDQREAWLGHAVARTLEASVGGASLFGGSQKACAFHDHLGRLLGIDVATWWRPTALNWFDRVAKAQCLAALAEIGATELGQRYLKAKKGEIAEACERVFAGASIIEADLKARALAWVPEPMRFDDGTPPWNVEAADADGCESEGDDALCDGAIVISDETAVTDAASDGGDAVLTPDELAPAEDVGDGVPAVDADCTLATGTETAMPPEAEPIAVTFVSDDPDLEGVTFTLAGIGDDDVDIEASDEPEDLEDEVGTSAEIPVDLAA
ncbi:ParB/RepB/Spo0J family partition protein [Novosphingobium sp. Gsoil 351]|uniref:ParB/RepB/Spo0J family partition protein n=1 Tax=Novosphingobium sp. Gsoil 351 TaxID=2675225 RepID=UPI0012B4B741|nr:ParB/RepB/Spo0J family partition protein [Novosphingobium sp. Gsoil 351]QGN54086.1 chromosome partitioning protein ParB [Novosphingobium sp. Gsoil 351]